MGTVQSVEQFAAIVQCSPSLAASWFDPMMEAMLRWRIETPDQQAMFLAQIAHESDNLQRLEENLNYRASRLMEVWPRRFPDLASTAPYAHNPEALANYVYSSRMENRDEASGDGWKFRGRGPIQITGARNYRLLSEDTNTDYEGYPDTLTTPMHGSISAGWYWWKNNCGPLAQAGDIRAVTVAINGGTIGLRERTELYNNALQLLT